MDGDGSSNAVAGPSTLPDPVPSYLPPPGPSRPPPYFKSTEDLLSKFQLLPAYESYTSPPLPSGNMSSDKVKGKQRDMSPTPDPHSTHVNDPDDDGLDKRKKKNSYRHLIKIIPGKHSTKKDDFLTTLMQVPPKQRIDIIPFDPTILRDAFSVGLDGLKGWNTNTLILETSQAREDRKKKKELKKFAKSHSSGGFPQNMHATPIQTDRVPGPRTTTPRPNPTGRPPLKREFEESEPNVTQQNHRQATPPAVTANGMNGIRPRPTKKQRMDAPQTRDPPLHQQHTPQGL